MAIFKISPTATDIRIANAISAHTDVPAEHTAEALTWGADEHVLTACAAAWWLYSRNKSRAQQTAANHVLITTLVASALPHLLKTVFDQRRPDRLTVRGHWRGVPLSGKSMDAFPSGHALHVGALASAACQLPKTPRDIVWLAGGARSDARNPARALGERRRYRSGHRGAHRAPVAEIDRLRPVDAVRRLIRRT